MRKHRSWPFDKLLQLVTISFLLLVPLYLGADTITADRSLTGDETIESEGGNFVLGFFEPPGSKSSNFYIGTWYKKVSEQTLVWVANRDSPVSGKYSSYLRLLNGNLVLTNGSKARVWSTNLTTTAVASKSIEAALLDNGNFVLREGSGSSQFIWQSFYHPTHAWLPGCKLGFNEKTKNTRHLTAWKNSADPATGIFSLELSPSATGDWLALWNRSVPYWTANFDFRTQKLLLPLSMELEYICNFSFVHNENESYYTYTLFDPSRIWSLIMDVSGQIKLKIWKQKSKQWDLFWPTPQQQCEVYAFCGAFGTCDEENEPPCYCLTGFSPKSKSDWDLGEYSGGCVRDTRLHSGNDIAKRDTDRFFLYQDMRLPRDAEYVTAHSQEYCRSSCLNNCTCTAYTYNSSTCMIWIGDLLDLKRPTFRKSSSGQNLYLRLAASEFPSNKVPGVLVGLIAASVSVLVLLFTAVLAIYRRKKMRSSGKTMAVEGETLLLAFAYRDLQKATKNFSEKLGGGAFGSVFKGTLPDSSVIAVKQLESVSQGEKQFRSEVSTLGTIQHVNLVRFRGFCAEGTTRKLLVYDYMANGSLETHLFCKKGYSIVLAWKTRYRIALGAARGLAYLHDNCRDRIVHCDVKPENILLDAEFCPKVGDFGLAKLIGRDFSRVLTTLRGTRGYLAPEWIAGAAITAKADVYGYGMMLFEILSGRRNSAGRRQSDHYGEIIDFFPAWAASQIISGGEDILGILDERLEGKADREEAVRICKLASWCIQDDENHRPSMGEVVRILEGVSEVNIPPVPRSLQLLFLDNQDSTVFFTDLSSSQGNTSTSSSRNQEQHQQSAINT